MARRAGLLLALGLAMLGRAWAATRAETSPSRKVEGQDMAEIRRYSDRLGRELLKESLGLDLDDLQLEFDPRDLSFSRPRKPGAGASAAPAAGASSALGNAPAAGLERRLSLRLEQSNDLRRLQQDLRDVPFGLSVNGQLPLLAVFTKLETSLWVPFSWKDEFRARAQLPLLGEGGTRQLTLRSDYRSQLGLSRWEAGLGTQIDPQGLGRWGLDYDFQRSFGQGTEEAIHWLKLTKSF